MRKTEYDRCAGIKCEELFTRQRNYVRDELLRPHISYIFTKTVASV